MQAFLCDDIRKYDNKKYGFMVIPCHWKSLAYKKSKEEQSGKCPVCGSVIYSLPDGWCGHC